MKEDDLSEIILDIYGNPLKNHKGKEVRIGEAIIEALLATYTAEIEITWETKLERWELAKKIAQDLSKVNLSISNPTNKLKIIGHLSNDMISRALVGTNINIDYRYTNDIYRQLSVSNQHSNGLCNDKYTFFTCIDPDKNMIMSISGIKYMNMTNISRPIFSTSVVIRLWTQDGTEWKAKWEKN